MEGRGRAMPLVLLLPLATSVLACDGIIGLRDPTVADSGSTQMPDVGEPDDASDDAGEGSREDASPEAADDDVVVVLNDGGDAGTTQADSTVPFPDAAMAPDSTCPTGADTCMTTGTPPGTDSGAARVSPATVILLNSSPDLPSVRVCLQIAGNPVDGMNRRRAVAGRQVRSKRPPSR
jgi:hypothetical protein